MRFLINAKIGNLNNPSSLIKIPLLQQGLGEDKKTPPIPSIRGALYILPVK
jgi:hypothetical protein